MSKIDFTSDDVHKNLMRFSVPMLFLSMLDYLGLFVNLGWLMVMSQEQHLPSVFRLSASVVGVLEAGFGGLLSAVYIYANQAFGRKDHTVARYLISFGFGLSIVIGVLIAFSGGLLGQQLLGAFGVEGGIKLQVSRYLDVLWYGYLAVIVHIYAGLIAKMAGDTGLITRFRVTTFLCNLLLTPLFILYAQARGLDVIQATAVAMILARLGGLAMLGYQLHRGQVFPYRLGVDFLPRRVFTEWRALTKLAAAETINGFSLTLSFFLFFVIVSYYEAGTLAAVTVSQYVTGFVQTVMIGTVAALIPFTAQNAGNQNIVNIGKGVRWMTNRVLIICLGISIPYVLLAPYFVGLFSPGDPVMAAHTLSYIRITTLPWAFLIASFPFIFAIVGLGDTRGTLLLTIWSMYLGNLLPMVIVLHWVGNTITHAAYAEAGAHLLTFFGCMAYYRYREKQLSQSWQASMPAQVAGATA